MRPYPEPRPRGGAVPAAATRVPPAAIGAGVLGIAGAPPLGMVVLAAVAVGGHGTDSGIDWWLYLLLVVPMVELWGAVWLLSGRSWRLLTVACLPGAALFAYVVWDRLAGPQDLGLGWVSLALVCPLLALLLAPTPPVRRWVETRRRAAEQHAVS